MNADMMLEDAKKCGHGMVGPGYVDHVRMTDYDGIMTLLEAGARAISLNTPNGYRLEQYVVYKDHAFAAETEKAIDIEEIQL
jgi:hypothetical protein